MSKENLASQSTSKLVLPESHNVVNHVSEVIIGPFAFLPHKISLYAFIIIIKILFMIQNNG